MRNFIKVFLFLMFGTAFGMDGVFPKLKDAKQETLVIFNCEGVVFSYLDAAFSEENKGVWADFSEKRSALDRGKDEKIDRALFFAPKRIADRRYKQEFKNLEDQKANMIFVYQINEDQMKFRNEGMIRSFIISILSEFGLNPNETSRIRLLITDSKKISSDIAEVVKDFSKTDGKSDSIKKVILVHDGSLELDKNQIHLPTEEILVDSQNRRVNVTRDQITKQLEILIKSGEWMDDVQIQRITNRSDEEIVYELCKQSIMDVCSCSEIIEENIYEKIASIVNDKASLEHLEEIIDDFQEIYNTLPNIFHYVGRVYLWEMCHRLDLEEQKSIEILKQIKQFYFNEHEVRDAPHKVVRRLGCGIHWRDMAKYEFVKDFLMTNEKVTKSVNSQREKIYQRVLNTVFDKAISNMGHMIEDKKNELIKILHENKVEDEKIMDVFKISEEKLKNIINANALKNEKSKTENGKKMKKPKKNT